VYDKDLLRMVDLLLARIGTIITIAIIGSYSDGPRHSERRYPQTQRHEAAAAFAAPQPRFSQPYFLL
jgi:hypothetical protein